MAEELRGGEPKAHAASPVVPEFSAHAAAPEAEELRPGEPRAHAFAPQVPEYSAHPDAPEAEELRPGEPTPHAGAPQAEELRPGEPTPHAGAPQAEELRPDESTTHAGAQGPAPRPSAPAGLAEPAQASVSRASIGEAVAGLLRAVRAAAGLASPRVKLDAWGKDSELAHSLRPIGDLLYEKYWRVRVDGAALIPGGPCIIVANHAGALPLDGPVLHLALRRERPDLPESRWLLEDQVFYAPFFGTLANRLGAVRASPENALRLLGDGRPLIVFPEGFHGLSKPFAERYQLRRFGRGGYVKIALRAGVPVVPAAIVGGEESMPLLAKIPSAPLGVPYVPVTLPPLPARWHVRFSEPLDLSEGREEDLSWVQRTNEKVRDEIQGMLARMLHERDGVF